jgi:monovalent cation:H+ antiporter-2, CPA2 family
VGIGNLMQLPFAASFGLGNVMALSSTAIVLRILEERGEIDSRHGRLALAVLLMQDLVLIPLLILQTVAAEGRSGWEGLTEIGWKTGQGVLLVGMFYLIVRLVLLRAFRGRDLYAERDIPVILSVIVCGGCAWSSHVAGFSPVLGAFVAGVLLADQPVAGQIRANVVPLRAVFVTIFFTSIGMLAGFPSPAGLAAALGLAAAIIAGKAMLAGAAIRAVGHPHRVAMLGGFALAQIGEFSFVLAEDALRRGLLPAEIFDPLITAAVLTLIATPYLFPLGLFFAGRMQSTPAGEAPRTGHGGPDAILVGFGPAGRQVYESLTGSGMRVVVIESNPDLIPAHDPGTFQIGDATSAEILLHAGLAGVRALVLTVPDPGVARTILQLARQMAPEVPVLIRARYHRYAGPLRRLGAETVADEEELIGRELAAAAQERLLPRPAAGASPTTSRPAPGGP